MSRTSPDPFSLAFDGFALWAEASEVMWLRACRMAQGGAQAEHEARRMVTEKFIANWQLGSQLATAGAIAPEEAAHKAVRHYRRRVRANRRRLSR